MIKEDMTGSICINTSLISRPDVTAIRVVHVFSFRPNVLTVAVV